MRDTTMSLRSSLIRLAHLNPELRKDLLPLLKSASQFRQEDVDLWKWSLGPKTFYVLEQNGPKWALHFYSPETDMVQEIKVFRTDLAPVEEAFDFATVDYKTRLAQIEEANEVEEDEDVITRLISDIKRLGYHNLEYRYRLIMQDLQPLFTSGRLPNALRLRINRANKQLSGLSSVDREGIAITILKDIQANLEK